METQMLEAFARGLGALPSAVEDVVRRAMHHFGDTTPDAETLTAWGTALKAQCTHLFVPPSARSTLEAVATKHGMSVELWQSLSPQERYTRARQLQPPAQRQKPQPVTLSLEQVAELATLAPMARLSKYRELQAQQGGGSHGEVHL